MKTMQIDYEELKRAGVRLLILFGSRARGRHLPGSDCDLAVLLAPTIGDPVGQMERVQDAIHEDASVDMVDLGDADPLLMREVAVDGELLFEASPGDFEEFRLRSIKLYMDTQWLRDAEAATLRSHFG